MFAIFIFWVTVFLLFLSLSLISLCTLGFCNQFSFSISIWICVYHLFFLLPTTSNKTKYLESVPPFFSCISNYFRSLLLLLLVSLLFFLSHTLQLTPSLCHPSPSCAAVQYRCSLAHNFVVHFNFVFKHFHIDCVCFCLSQLLLLLLLLVCIDWLTIWLIICQNPFYTPLYMYPTYIQTRNCCTVSAHTFSPQ